MKSSFRCFVAGGMTVLGVLMIASRKCQFDQWLKAVSDTSCEMRQKFKEMSTHKKDHTCHEG